MKILLIDTCGSTGSVALADTEPQPAILAIASLPGRTAAERLVPAIKDLTARAGVGLQSLGAVAIVHGPGSFTGVRVGLSAAKGLCEALNLPLVAISRLAVLAHPAESPVGAHVHALLDAGRGEFYYGVYVDGTCLQEILLTRDELLGAFELSAAKASANVAGTATEPPHLVVACEPSVAESVAALSPRLVAEPTAEDALPLALLRIKQQDFDDAATLDANYLRRTDAEIFAKPRPKASQVAGPHTGTPLP
jgi:tRNA threonylcarbamoyladenosine biosynthesis protein TsaB